jgi:uncharacterized protein
MPFDFPPFRPHSLVRGGHLQTIAGCYLPSRVDLPGIQSRVPLADGDSIVLHDDGCIGSKGAVAILVHGLGGSHQSGYMQRTSAKLQARGVRVFRMDLRGCGAGLPFARHPVHAGRSEDLAAVLAHVAAASPGSPIHLVGFSMGANIVLKLAGELADSAPPNLASVMAVSPPMDLAECSRYMQRGAARYYDRLFVRGLLQHLKRRAAVVADAHSRPLDPFPRRLHEFDNVFTAPLCGFADVHDYYARASCAPLLDKIAIPTLIVAAASDPIVPVQTFERAKYSPSTTLHIAPCGGHLGFVASKSGDTDLRWLDWRTVDWVTSHAATASALPVRHHAQNRPVDSHVTSVVERAGRIDD